MLSVPAVWPVVVVLGHDADAIRAAVDFHDARGRRVRGLARGAGGVAARGVAALGDVDAAVVVLGDQPRITPQVIAWRRSTATGARTRCAATYGGEPGHPVLLGARLLERASASCAAT